MLRVQGLGWGSGFRVEIYRPKQMLRGMPTANYVEVSFGMLCVRGL